MPDAGTGWCGGCRRRAGGSHRRRRFRSGTRASGTPTPAYCPAIIQRTRPIQWSKHTLNQSRIQTREAIPGEQSGLEIGIGRRARRAYGFDEVALVPGGVTLNPDEVDITFSMGDRFTLPLPFWGSAIDGVVDVDFAIAMGKLGGVAVLNLDGVHTRYEDSAPVIKKIADADKATLNAVLKEAYREPVKPGLISERIKAIKAAGVPCAVSTVPARAEERAEIVQKAGADVYLVQGTVLTARHSSRSYHQLSFEDLVRACDIPVVVGNCVQFDTALELMETGIARILVGTKATLREILPGPARVDDGSQNFAGALRSALGVCGARDIAEFQHTEMVIAPSIVSEGKVFQQAQHVGMGKS